MTKKKPFLCRIGLHSLAFWNGYDFCTRPGCGFENPPGWLPTDKKEG